MNRCLIGRIFDSFEWSQQLLLNIRTVCCLEGVISLLFFAFPWNNAGHENPP